MSSPLITCCLLFVFLKTVAGTPRHINAILHDQSYIAFSGSLPDSSIDEQTRIRVHLSYVQHLLRNAPAAHLTMEQHNNRLRLLDLLQRYWQAGDFPVNEAFLNERRPCFIDKYGNICAVGYLVEQTEGRAMAEYINKKHQYDFILDMNEPMIEQWARVNGLTLLECAMI